MKSPSPKYKWSPGTLKKKINEIHEKNKNIIKLAKIKKYEMERVRLAKLLREVTKKLNNLKL